MGKPHSTPRATLPPKAPTRSLSKPAAAMRTGIQFLLFMTQRHPILFWTGSWLVMVFLSWIAISGLLYTNPAPLEIAESPQAKQVVESPQPQPQVQPSKPATSLGLLVAVAVSCALTTGFLARQLRPVKPSSRRLIKRTVSAGKTARKTPPAVSARRNEGTAPQPATQAAAQTARLAPKAQPPKDTTSAAQPSQATVTVMPPEGSRSSGWGDGNLADMLDIRNRKSMPL